MSKCKKKECCCTCKFNFVAIVCNALGEWDGQITEKGKINDGYGSIGYACLVRMDDQEAVYIRKKEHRGCGLYSRKLKKQEGKMTYYICPNWTMCDFHRLEDCPHARKHKPIYDCNKRRSPVPVCPKCVEWAGKRERRSVDESK